MKRWIFAFTVSLLCAATTVFAQGGAKPKPPQASSSAKPPKPSTPSAKPVKSTGSSAKPTQGSKVKPVKATKPSTSTSAKATKPAKSTKPAKTTKPEKTTKSAKADTKDKKSTTTTTTTAATTTEPTLTPVQQKLKKNTSLASKLESRLPAGTDLMKAAEGFRNLGQFVAAVNVSYNLDIPFDKLKVMMVEENKSLGQSIQALKNVSSPTIEAQRAEYDARGMIAQSEQEMAAAGTTASAAPTTVSTASKSKKQKPPQPKKAVGGQ